MKRHDFEGFEFDEPEEGSHLQDLVCSICMSVATDPTELVPCGHLYCTTCCASLTKCPACRCFIKQRRKPTRAVKNILERAPGRCVCGWTGTKGGFTDTHKNTCPRSGVPTGGKNAAVRPSLHGTCFKGHELLYLTEMPRNFTLCVNCDGCGRDDVTEGFLHCPICDYDRCKQCCGTSNSAPCSVVPTVGETTAVRPPLQGTCSNGHEMLFMEKIPEHYTGTLHPVLRWWM